MGVDLLKGFVGSIQCSLGESQFDIIVISRRNTKRAGTRLITRGANEKGEVANLVLTEQIVHFKDGSSSSFVQSRGSIPCE